MTALHDLIAVKSLARQLEGARRAGDRLALERLSDALDRAELVLTADERDALHRDVAHGLIEPGPYAHTKSKTKSRPRGRGEDEDE